MMLHIFLLFFLIVFPVICGLCEILSRCSDDNLED